MAREYAAAMPSPSYPFVDPTTGTINPAWLQCLIALYGRTGGASGNASKAAVDVSLEPSPFSYEAPQLGAAIVSGGGVIRLEINNGNGWYSTGSWYGLFPLGAGAKLRMTYVGSPSLTFIPE
jgi:hypothetical protein